MKNIYIYIPILFLSNILTAWGQTASQNYVGTQTMLKAYNSEAEDDSLVAGAELVSRTEIQYYDGLGRPTYNVQNGQSPSNRNLGTMTEYDNAQSLTRNWLAVPVYGSQDYQSAADFKNAASMAHGTEHAFTVTATDALGRDDYWQNAGDAWHTGSRIVKTEYVTNGEKSIIQYSAPTDKNSLVRDGYYAACMLDGMKTTDEDGHTLEVYTDMFGRKVLERRNGNNDTYFVYNVLGQLRYVLTPQYQADKAKDTGAYEYRYDSNGNVVKKVIPGCEYMQYWYDTNDRVIAMQDGRMRAGTGNNHHMFYIYDKFGRLAIQGGCTGLAHPGGDTAVLDITAPHDKTVDFGGYTVMYPYNFNNPKAEIVNYYDDYAFVKYCGALKRLPVDSLRQELIQTPAVEFRGIEYGKGQLTGQFVVDSEQNYTLTAYFYDIRGNVIASRSISSDRTYTSTRTEYTFLNAVRRTVQTVIKGFGTPNARKTGTDIVNTYDERSGKLLHSDLTVTDGNVSKSRRIESYGYDDLGRVSKLEQGNGVHKTSYGYDLHGWTTAVTGDAFTESLGYATGESPCYNGNI
ncbi:MAG: hypothetical protein K2G12_10065, partial [Prevotella sp.]|nr:hypothetical protein [Prevotella sp.]